MAREDVYSKGVIINFKEGDKTLERELIKHVKDPEDRVHIFKEGESLTQLSFIYYKEPKYWYLIADINLIENPLFIEAGTQLIIPNITKYLL